MTALTTLAAAPAARPLPPGPASAPSWASGGSTFALPAGPTPTGPAATDPMALARLLGRSGPERTGAPAGPFTGAFGPFGSDLNAGPHDVTSQSDATVPSHAGTTSTQLLDEDDAGASPAVAADTAATFLPAIAPFAVALQGWTPEAGLAPDSVAAQAPSSATALAGASARPGADRSARGPSDAVGARDVAVSGPNGSQTEDGDGRVAAAPPVGPAQSGSDGTIATAVSAPATARGGSGAPDHGFGRSESEEGADAAALPSGRTPGDPAAAGPVVSIPGAPLPRSDAEPPEPGLDHVDRDPAAAAPDARDGSLGRPRGEASAAAAPGLASIPDEAGSAPRTTAAASGTPRPATPPSEAVPAAGSDVSEPRSSSSDGPLGEPGASSASAADARPGEPSRAETTRAEPGLPQTAPEGRLAAPIASLSPHQAALAVEAAAPDHPVATGVPLAAVPVEIGLRSLAGTNRFDIRLAPEELGRIDISLDIAKDGAVTARLVVERPETLAALQREAPQLERALEQAGLKTHEASLDLSLRDPSSEGAGGGRGGSGGPTGDDAGGRPSSAAPRDRAQSRPEGATPDVARSGQQPRASGVDLRV